VDHISIKVNKGVVRSISSI